MISVCVAVYRAHEPPNLSLIGEQLDSALGGEPGELLVALNGIDATSAGVPSAARTADLGVNRGVAPGWNAAARLAGGDVLVFCNDDVALGPGSLARLAAVLAENPGVGVVGPVGSIWDLADGRHLGDVTPADDAELVSCDVVSGFLFACRQATWSELGGFDEAYAPASWEEVDFCTAVRASGLSCAAVGGVACEHEWGVSRRQMPWARVRWDGRSETWRSIHRRNRRRFLSKWAGSALAAAASE
jgi:GT2 family glycosyltransferase